MINKIPEPFSNRGEYDTYLARQRGGQISSNNLKEKLGTEAYKERMRNLAKKRWNKAKQGDE